MRRLACVLAAVLVLAGCTGVPDSSAPQTVAPVRVDPVTSDAPSPGAIPRAIVTDFLTANVNEAGRHASARSFLTPTARNSWSDQRVTVISGRQISTGDPATNTVQVTGRVVGTINADGIYQPSLQGSGDGGRTVSFPFKVIKNSDGQNRIDQLRNGLLITDDQFQESYQQRVIYYYDLAGRYLVPDVRWSSITDSARLARWLVDQLASPPRPELQDVVSTDTFPAQADPTSLTVKLGAASLSVEIPGSSQLERPVRSMLAAQLAQTLNDVVPGGVISVTDGGAPVTIPSVNSTTFSAAQFSDATGPVAPTPNVYYLDNGRITAEDGKHISGPLGDGSVALTSLAVARRGASNSLLVAAAEGNGASQQLVIGTQSGGVQDAPVRGALTRPTWVPGLQEVWVGVGAAIHRLTVSGRTVKDSLVQLPVIAGGGTIRALQFSPDGSQLALVVAGTGASAQLYVGAVVRDTGAVRVSGLQPISPAGVVITDAGWSNSSKLTATGYLASTGDASIYETGADGSFWTTHGITGLPAPPDNITVSNIGTWAESDDQVWTLTGSVWESPSPTGQALGTKPTYLD